MSIKRALKFFVGLTILVSGFLLTRFVFAQIEPGLNVVGAEIALPAADPRIVAARIIRVALGFLGIIALAIVLYGGFVWMTSAGNPEKIDKAKKILTNGVIGLIIIIFAFGITQYVLNALLGQYVTPGGGAPPPPPVVERLSGSLGNGIIESHYPPRGGTGIPRNTKIIVTFKEAMSLKSIINNYNDNGTPTNLADDTVTKNDNGTTVVTVDLPDPTADDWMELKNENVKIYKSINGETAALVSNQVKVTFTTDLKTFVFDPVDLLGSASENIWHTVGLKSRIKKADGSDAFAGAFRDGYLWDFEVSTFVDTTPPQVESTWPPLRDPGREEEVPRNTVIQINFDEAIDPTTINLDNITVKVGDAAIAGTWTIGNQYKTAEFTTDVWCGTNSCGGDVFCLPGLADIDVLVKAATLSIDDPQDPEPPEAEWPYDGITDVVGNSLDGNKNGSAQGSDRDDARFVGEPPTRVEIPGQVDSDNYGVTFRTTDEIDLVPPVIEDVVPVGSNVRPFDVPIEIRFSKRMMVSTFNTSNIILEDNQEPECAVWFTFGAQSLDEDNSLIPPSIKTLRKHKAIIFHGDFLESTEPPVTPAPICAYVDGRPIEVDPQLVMYYPRATHNVKDLTQNCFFAPEGPGVPPAAKECVRNSDGTMPLGCPWAP